MTGVGTFAVLALTRGNADRHERVIAVLLAIVARALWPHWRRWVLPLCGVFLVIDIAFVIANGATVLQGAWFPLVLGVTLFTLLRTWRRGRQLLHRNGGVLAGRRTVAAQRFA